MNPTSIARTAGHSLPTSAFRAFSNPYRTLDQLHDQRPILG